MKKLALMLVFVASAAYGEIYRWTDSKGTTHYTNSIYEIPERYRAKAKTVNLGIPEAKTDSAAPSPPLPGVPQVQPAATGTSSPQPASPVAPVTQAQPPAVAPRADSHETKRVRTTKGHRSRSHSDEEE